MRIGVVAGEASGDQLGAGLMRALREIHPDCEFEGVAGPAMQQAGCIAWEESEALSVMGLVEPLRELPRLIRLRRSLVARWSARPPAVFVGIDSPDFNLGLEIALRKRGIPTIQYVSPTVWAWRPGRVRTVARAADRVLCLLPFEKAFYDRHGIAADFVGHPLADIMPSGLSREVERERLGLDPGPVVAVLPGSRRSEVTRLGPLFAAASRELRRTHPDLRFVAPMATVGMRSIFEAQLEEASVAEHFRLADGNAAAAIAAADVVLLASGTAALQAALLARPIVAAYRVAGLTFALARALRLLKVRHITLPNLLTDEPLVPEYLQGAATPAALAAAVSKLLRDPDRRAGIESEFAKLRHRLARGADRRAAEAVLEVAGRAVRRPAEDLPGGDRATPGTGH
jgi:lipid-A-disaccharide synthase